MTPDNRNELGKMLRQRRLITRWTLRELVAKSGVSASHLGRIETGKRFPSASVLHKIAKPLGFEESELLTLAGYLSPQSPITSSGRVDPYVAAVLSQEPVEVQRAVIGILSILKSSASGKERHRN